MTRRRLRERVAESLDGLRRTLGPVDDPEFDIDRLTDAERAHADALLANVTDADGLRDLSRLSYRELCVLRALVRKASNAIDVDSPFSPQDRHDVAILERLNTDSAATPAGGVL